MLILCDVSQTSAVTSEFFISPEIGLYETYRALSISMCTSCSVNNLSLIPPTVNNVVCKREVKPFRDDQWEFNTDIY